MFLAVTALEEFWDPAQDMLFLGPWCLRHDRRARWPKAQPRVLPNPWRDRERFGQAVAYCRDTAERLLQGLAERLNAALGLSRETRYWRTLLGLWLTYHVQQTYDHYAHLQDALKAHPGLATLRLDPSSHVTPWDGSDFMRLSLEDAYQLQIYSHVLSHLLPGSPTRALEQGAAGAGRSSRGLPRFFRRCLWSAGGLRNGAGAVWTYDLYLRPWEEGELALRTGFRVRPFCEELPAKPGPVEPSPHRAGLKDLPARDEFEKILVSGLPRHLPCLYLEGFPAARDFVQGILRKGAPAAIATAGQWDGSEALKFLAAEAAERGTRLLSLQHGGGYGFLKYAPAEEFERAISDRFYAWGWAGLAQDPKVKDLPHPKVSRPLSPDPAGHVLLVSSLEPRHNIRLGRGPLGDQGEEYLEWQTGFIAALSPETRASLLVRAYAVDYGWGQASRLRDRFPGLRLDSPDAPFRKSLGRSRLAVFDHPGTTWLEALAAGVPCLAFWDQRYWELRDGARPFLRRLRDAGLWHDSPESAAARLEAVRKDPQDWWASPTVSAAREAFVETFARGSARWAEAWAREWASL